ncbi:MAG: peptide ABC transporter substrate-binding protein, partial [Roseinatronobacter sp.]
MTVIAQPRAGVQDPHDCTDASDTLTIYHAVYDTLVRRVGQDFVPHLARAGDVSADAAEWTCQLQPLDTFQDGT